LSQRRPKEILHYIHSQGYVNALTTLSKAMDGLITTTLNIYKNMETFCYSHYQVAK
jgi:hypothetical protein